MPYKTPEQARRAKWKREYIEGDFLRKGMHILHVKEVYSHGELYHLHFYYTDAYRAVNKVVYDARKIRLLRESRVSPPSLGGFVGKRMMAVAAPFIAYHLSDRFFEEATNVLLSLYVLTRSLRFMKRSTSSYLHDSAAWKEYRKYAASLEPIPEPDKLYAEITQEDSSLSSRA